MGADEAGTLARLTALRQDTIEPMIARHHGRVVKLMGDGLLAEFASVVDAVTCAVEWQDGVVAHEVDHEPDERINFRIGINLGDIIVEGDDIHGDGVNIAARLETLAVPGGLCLSEDAWRQVRGKLDLTWTEIGPQRLKNVAEPVMTYALARSSAPQRAAKATAKPSVAVLPFANMSHDPEQEYFSDGITEDIITDLSKISALGVIARNTSFQFKGKSVDVPQIARQLQVNHILEGSVRRAGGRIRITAQLVDGTSGEHVWAERYDRDIRDIFALQDEISETIVKVLKLKLLPEEKASIERRSTINPEAYELYLMARHFSIKGSLRHQKVIERLCRRALEIDAGYAAAWAQLAIALSNRRLIGGEPIEGGLEAAERAIALDPSLADAYAAKGRIMSDRGHYDEAVSQLDTALRLDPESYEVNAASARCAVAENRHDEAIRFLEKAAQVSPTDFWALGMAVGEYQVKGDQPGAKSAARRALDRIEKIIADQPDHGSALSFGVIALIALGEQERAMEWAERALLLDPDNSNLHYNLACAMVKIGLTDRALQLLAGLLERSQPEGLRWIKADRDLDAIRDAPSFKAMLADAEARLAEEAETGAAPGS
jgi:adenylate cyclase